MHRFNKLFVFFIAMAIAACSSGNPFVSHKDPAKNGPKEYAKNLGIKLDKGANPVKVTPIGFAGKSNLLTKAFDDAGFDATVDRHPAFKTQAIYWPAGVNRNDVYGLIESFTNYSHYFARTGVSIPVTYASVPVGIPESICIVQNGQYRCDLTATVSTNPGYPLPITSHCAFDGINSATSYYPLEMFSAPHDIFILFRDNGGPIFPQNYFVTTGAYAANCNRYFYRVTVNVKGYSGDPITSATNVRFFSTSSWDRVQNDFPLYTATTPNSTADGRLIQFYVTSDTPVLFKPEYRTANILWTWRIGSATLQSIDRWTTSSPTVGTWANVPICTGTAFTQAFDLNSATGPTNVDEGYLARFNHTVAGCVQPQLFIPFSVQFQ